MLKTIAAPAPELVNFLEGLKLPLNHPQQPLSEIGTIDIKGKRPMETWFLLAQKSL